MVDHAERRPRSNLLLWGLLTLVAVNSAVFVAVFTLEPKVGKQDIELAERFMKAIELGSGVDPEGARRSGYEQAWDLVDAEAKAKIPYAEFIDFFEGRITDLGFIQTWRRLPFESGVLGDRLLRYEIEYRGFEGEATTQRFILRVIERGGSHRIGAYSEEERLSPGEGR